MRALRVLVKLIPAIGSAAWLCGCAALIPGPLETAVGQDQVDLAIRGFLDSSAILARAFSYEAYVDVVPVRAAANKITGIGNKRTFVLEANCPIEGQALCSLPHPAAPIGAVTNYVRNGWHLSQLLCRNYLAGLSDKNSAFSAIKKEFNIAGGLAQLTMAAAKASARSIAYFGAVEAFVNASLENFSEFEYLTPDQSALQDVVVKAQNALGEYYTGAGVPTTIVEAINAVHRIESQCTRAGLRHLINRSLTNVGIATDEKGNLIVTGDSLKLFDTSLTLLPLQLGYQKINGLKSQMSAIIQQLQWYRVFNPSDPRVGALQQQLDDLQKKIETEMQKLLPAPI